jgi:large subunit ribosomal protein L18
MNELKAKKLNKIRRKNRIRSKIMNHSQLLRLSVYISNRFVYAQIIDDQQSKTLVSANSLKLKDANLTIACASVGKEIAQKALKKKINKVVLDRNGKLYHGRIKALVEAARKEGLEV